MVMETLMRHTPHSHTELQEIVWPDKWPTTFAGLVWLNK